MNKLLLKTGLAAALCLMLAAPAMAQTKVGLINLKRVFDGYWKTKKADANLTERANDFKKTGKEMMDGYKTANEDYKKLLDSANDQALSSEERDRRKKSAETKLREIQDLEGQIQQFDRTMRTTLNEQNKLMRDAVLRDIQEVVARHAKTAGYAMVFDTMAESVNNTPILMYHNGENELSSAVLKELNANAPAEWLKLIDDGAATNSPPKAVETPDKKPDKKK